MVTLVTSVPHWRGPRRILRAGPQAGILADCRSERIGSRRGAPEHGRPRAFWSPSTRHTRSRAPSTPVTPGRGSARSADTLRDDRAGPTEPADGELRQWEPGAA